MKFDSKTGLWILVITAIPIFPAVIYFSQETTQTINLDIIGMAVFDPHCMETQKNNETSGHPCDSMMNSYAYGGGGSYNIYEFNDNDKVKTLLLKIDNSKIPTNVATQTTIQSSSLSLNLFYESINFTGHAQDQFLITYGVCDFPYWSSDSLYESMSCFDERGYPQTKTDSFYGILSPERITSINLGMASHIEYAIKNNEKQFTELITFYPTSYLDNNSSKKIIACMGNHTSDGYGTKCIKSSQLDIYTTNYPEIGFQPKLVVNYQTKPTVLIQSINTVVFAIYPLIGSFLIYLRGQENNFNSKMIRVCDSLRKEVEDTLSGLKSGVGNTVPVTVLEVQYDENYDPMRLTLNEPVCNVILFNDAYNGIISSGSFENFTKDNQIRISTLYNYVSENNRIWRLYTETINQFQMMPRSAKDIPRIQWALGRILSEHLEFLATLRNNIINLIEAPKDGILAILDEEKKRYGK